MSLRDAPLSRDLAEFEIVAAPHREHRRRAAVVGSRRLHLSNDVYFSVRSLASYDDHEVAEAVGGGGRRLNPTHFPAGLGPPPERAPDFHRGENLEERQGTAWP